MTKRPLFQLVTPILSAILLTGLVLAYPTLVTWLVKEIADLPPV